MENICLICCFTYPATEMTAENSLEHSDHIVQLCKNLNTDSNELKTSVEKDWINVFVCEECLDSVKSVTHAKHLVQKTEENVRRLEKELQEKRQLLKSNEGKWQRQLRKLEGVVRSSDENALLLRANFQTSENVENPLVDFRKRIGEEVVNTRSSSSLCAEAYQKKTSIPPGLTNSSSVALNQNTPAFQSENLNFGTQMEEDITYHVYLNCFKPEAEGPETLLTNNTENVGEKCTESNSGNVPTLREEACSFSDIHLPDRKLSSQNEMTPFDFRVNEDNKFMCDQCNKVFTDKWNLKKHVQNLHEERKPFTCSYCQKKFAKRCDLTRHVRLHTGEMPFTCPLCDEKFTTKSNLRYHLRKHNDGKRISN